MNRITPVGSDQLYDEIKQPPPQPVAVKENSGQNLLAQAETQKPAPVRTAGFGSNITYDSTGKPILKERLTSQVENSKTAAGQNRDGLVKANPTTQKTDFDWNKVGAINTQNTTADSDSAKLGRDNFKANEKMLDGQLDNKDNSYLRFKGTDGKDYLAYRSQNEAYGTYHGFKEIGSKELKDIKDAPTDVNKLKNKLDQIYKEKQDLISKHGNNENFKIAQGIRGEIADLKDLYSDLTKFDGNKSKSDAVQKIDNIFKDLESIKNGDKGQNVSAIQARYDAIKNDHPEVAADLAISRLDKASGILGNNETNPLKKSLEDKLTDLGATKSATGFDFSNVKNKDDAIKAIKEADQAINDKITQKRNQGQQLDDKQKAEYDKRNKEVDEVMEKLASKHAGDSEFQKLQKHYDNNGKFAADPNSQNRGKHALEELRAFQGHLEKSGWTKKANVDEKISSNESGKATEKVFKNPNEFNDYIKKMSPGERIQAKSEDGNSRGYFTKDTEGNVYRDNGNFMAQKMDPKDYQKTLPFKDTERYFIQKKQDSYKIYKGDYKLPNIYLAHDRETDNKKVFTGNEDSNGSIIYQELEAAKHDKANVEAYKVTKNSVDHYLMLNPEKNGFWEIKSPKNEYGVLSAGKYEIAIAPDKVRSTTIDGLKFEFFQDGSLIGLTTNQNRKDGLSYTDMEMEKALELAFLSEK